MNRLTEKATLSLMAVYAKFYAEDFTASVMSNLQASYPIEDDYLQTFVAEQLSDKLADQSKMDLKNPNVATRFLCELATHAIENDLQNMESREVYNQIKVLPSLHHAEIDRDAFHAAQLYDKTLDQTVINVIAKEAKIVADTITAQAKERITSVDTGGRVRQFNWGILNDGLWLNSALVKAYELANIFHPSSRVDSSWSRTGFQFARSKAATRTIDNDKRTEALATLSLIEANLDPEVLSQNAPSADGYSVAELAFQYNAMNYALDKFEQGLTSPAAMVSAIAELSGYATLIPQYVAAAASLGDDVITDASVIDRLHQVNDTVTLCLASFEALRETRFTDTLIMCVEGQGNDPFVDVYVNGDSIRSFTSQGGKEEDLIKFGHHLDPRKGTYTPSDGWQMKWVSDNTSKVIAQVDAQEADRLQQRRNNDAVVIQELAQNNLRNIATSYAQACDKEELSHPIVRQIDALSRRLTDPKEGAAFSLAGETVTLLCDVIDQPFLTATANSFMSYASSEDEKVRTNARALAVASAAVNDAVGFFVKPV